MCVKGLNPNLSRQGLILAPKGSDDGSVAGTENPKVSTTGVEHGL